LPVKEVTVRKLIALLAVASLSGCVAYGVPYGSAELHYSNSPYYSGGPYYDGTPHYGGYTYGSRYYRDRDRDGVPNRYDRDRDGDGVSNRRDAYPNDPRRY
jgi:hypothetical protein